MVEQTELEKRHAAAMESVGTLQRKLDEQLQLHVDKDAAHAAEKEALKKSHDDALAAERAAHANVVESMRSDHAAALAKLESDLTAKHAAEILALKESSLVPALKDLHARQAADLAAKHAADLAKLQ